MPNELEVTLPGTGKYKINVNHRGFFKTDGFKGDYCLTLQSTGDAARTLARKGSVE